MPGEFMSIEEAAKYLNMSEEAIQLLAEKGVVRKDKDGKMLIKAAEIRDWLHRGIKDFDLSQLNALEKDYREHVTPIHTLLNPKCIKRALSGVSKSAVICELIDLLVQKGGIAPKHKKAILTAVIERERMCSTALADGVAIPHPREPLAGIIKKPRLVLGLSWRGIDFESFDGKATHVVVLLCTPRLDLHLQIIARLSRLLRNAKMRVAMCRAKDEKELIEVFATFEKQIPL
ncbi:MAG: PTS sugar transporter subunit IIA [Candidatus Aureabacteria bacterium]|nr:PTS sugar transporter subunit IIA [Candidatus Auribacterota bacterium]